jgi:hypothetical protein
MNTGQGGTVAATAAMLLGLAAAAVAAPAATAAPRAKAQQRPANVAIAVGRSEDGTTWRLEGRRLTVRLGAWSAETRRRVEARCGEELVPWHRETGAVRSSFVVSAGRAVVVGRFTKVLRMTLPRDVAGRATWCGLVGIPGAHETELPAATMRGVRGAVRGCRRSANERIVARGGRVRIARSAVAAGSGTIVAYRVCLSPHGRYLPLLGETVAAGERKIGLAGFGLRISGSWLAWELPFRSARGEPRGTRTYRARVGEWAVMSEQAAPGWLEALAADGTVVSLDGETYRDVREPGTVVVTERRRLYVAGPGARRATLIASASALGDGARPIGGIRLSADGRTVTWTENGETRSAPVPR